ncbi:MAG: hypothetical protein HZC03_00505 [Candidatus Lloydbacteria bacterium]|nr:hypothetical protein [Candidatus Lloydbacteria bacterium]
MKKSIKIVFWMFGIVAVILTVWCFFIINPLSPSVDTSPNARTLYEGSVGVEPISLSEMKARLEKQGCHTKEYRSANNSSKCLYQETEVAALKKTGIEIYPNGPGFGPVSFFITENTLWAEKDIRGAPNPETFKEFVRKDAESIGGIIKIKENSWNITQMEYPWTVLY